MSALCKPAHSGEQQRHAEPEEGEEPRPRGPPRVVGLYASVLLKEGDMLALRLGRLLRDYIGRFGEAPAVEVLRPFFFFHRLDWVGKKEKKERRE